MDENRSEFKKGSLILVTGVTGYVGSHLIKALKRGGHRMRFIARNTDAIKHESNNTEVVQCDVLEADSLEREMQGVHTAYFLIHSMNSRKDYVEVDRKIARKFGEYAKRCGVKRIIYLGGLGKEEEMSPHLASRREVGNILRESGVPVVEFRASIIIGAGSSSYEIIRAVTERIPIIFAPLWSKTECQPIYIGNVISYLSAALEKPVSGNKIYEIGSADVTCYQCLMQSYAKRRRLPRLFLRLPMLSPRLAATGLILTNPSLVRLGRPLLEGLSTRTVVNDDSARKDFGIIPLTSERAIETALNEEDREFATTSWMAKLNGIKRKPYGGLKFGHRYVDTYFTHINCRPDHAFQPVECIGGETGWYCGRTLMRIRAFVDGLAGGPGWLCCRPDSDRLRRGDRVDNWHVLDYQENRRLHLVADMRMPGRGWLDFEVEEEDGGTQLRITAIFDPAGLSGLIYWFGIYPFHGYIFRGMLREMAKRAEAQCEGPSPVKDAS